MHDGMLLFCSSMVVSIDYFQNDGDSKYLFSSAVNDKTSKEFE